MIANILLVFLLKKKKKKKYSIFSPLLYTVYDHHILYKFLAALKQMMNIRVVLNAKY